jgi:hypothetical protein
MRRDIQGTHVHTKRKVRGGVWGEVDLPTGRRTVEAASRKQEASSTLAHDSMAACTAAASI